MRRSRTPGVSGVDDLLVDICCALVLSRSVSGPLNSRSELACSPLSGRSGLLRRQGLCRPPPSPAGRSGLLPHEGPPQNSAHAHTHLFRHRLSGLSAFVSCPCIGLLLASPKWRSIA